MSQPRDEIDPFILSRVSEGQFQCAVWSLAEGQRALALFLTPEAAQRYREAAGLGDEWRTHQPAREEIIQLLRHSVEAGIRYAVLDPGEESARRLFDLQHVLRSLDETG